MPKAAFPPSAEHPRPGNRPAAKRGWPWSFLRRRVLLLAAVLAVAVASVVSVYSAHEAVAPPPQQSQQVKLQSSIVNDRMHLFNGVLMYRPPNPIAVGDTQELDVTLIAIGQNPGEVLIPPGNVIGSRSLRVGGVEGATLSVRGGGVLISQVGPAHRLIGQPGDRADWVWDITPMQPGEYTLELVVVTYQGTSDNPLSIVDPPVPITLNVPYTWSYTVNSVKGWIIGLAAFLAAVAIIFTFFREQVFGLLPKRKKKEEEQSATPPE